MIIILHLLGKDGLHSTVFLVPSSEPTPGDAVGLVFFELPKSLLINLFFMTGITLSVFLYTLMRLKVSCVLTALDRK